MDGENPKQKPITVRSPRSGAEIIPGNPGNSGGKRGRSGRKPDEFKEACRVLASSAAVMKHARKVLSDPSHPQWLGAWKHVTEHGFGKAPQALDVTSGGGKITLNLVPGDDD